MKKERREFGYAGLLGLLISVAIILILTTLYFMPGDEEEGGSEGKRKIIPAVKQANQTALKVKLMGVQHSIQAFKALEGRYPRTLDELRGNSSYAFEPLPAGYEYTYDPGSGKVVVSKDGKTVCK